MVTKQRRLQLAELMGTPSLKDEPEAPKVEKSDGFAKQMIEKIVQNIQLFVNKVHVRYEDSISSPGVRGLPFACVRPDVRVTEHVLRRSHTGAAACAVR